MSKIPEETMSARQERVLLLLRRNPNGLTEQEIAEELSIERRTVNNYLRRLDQRGEVYKDGVYWGALASRGIVIRRLELSPEEAMTLYLTVRLLVKFSDFRNETAELLLQKLAMILSEDVGLGDDILEAARQLVSRPTAKGYESIYRTMMQAYVYRRQVAIRYQPYQGKPFETVFSPYLLEPSAIGYTVYAIGHSQIVNALRTYKFERIQSARLLRDSYVIPDDFPGQELLRNAWSIFYGETSTEVVLRFSPEVISRVQETIWHPSQQLEPDSEKPGFLRMILHVAAVTDLIPWIRGWGGSCEVVAPAELRDTMIGEARQLAHLYGWHTSKGSATDEGPDHSRFGDIFGA